MKVLLFGLLGLILFQQPAFSQDLLSISTSTGSSSLADKNLNFKFNLGANSPTAKYPPHISSFSSTSSTGSNTISYANPATATFVELGDGNFSFDENFNHTYSGGSLIYPISYKATAVYDDDPRPPRHKMDMPAGVNLTTGPAHNLTMHGILDDKQHIKLTPNINSVLAKDTMIFIITYKLDLNSEGAYIKFAYNNFDVFNKIVNPADLIVDGTNQMPFFRT